MDVFTEHDSICNCEDGGDLKYYYRDWKDIKNNLTLPNGVEKCPKCNEICSYINEHECEE